MQQSRHRGAPTTPGLVIALAVLGCGSGPGDVADAGSDAVYGHKSFDTGAADEPEAAPKKPFDRMEPHGGVVLAAPHIRAIYVGTEGVDESPSFDAYLSWLLTSTGYWSILAQYGVGYGTFDGSTRVDTSAFFTPGMVNSGVVDWFALDTRLAQVVHAAPSDAGAADAADDAGAPTLPPIPPADAYILFLPDHVNVDLGGEGMTCQSVGGYHSYDGQEPYAIIPPCRYHITIAHEMAEMATDPMPGQGWFSDADVANAGGEVGDLCNWLTYVNGNQVTALWSNADGDCEPQ